MLHICTILIQKQGPWCCGKQFWVVSGKAKHVITTQPGNAISRNIPEATESRGGDKCLHAHVQSSTGHNSQTAGTTQVSINGCTDKQNVASPNNGLV